MARTVRGRLPLFGTLLVIAVAALVVQLAEPGKAVQGDPAPFNTAQVRLFERDGGSTELMGGGTLVDRNWVLTCERAVSNQGDPAAYTIRFGVVNNANDQHDQANVRQIDRIVSPPGAGGLLMMHFADPVPEGMVIRQLATSAPNSMAPLYAFGWGAPRGGIDGTVLRLLVTTAYDPVATVNAAARRLADPDFEELFPPSIQPIALNLETHERDVGSGSFAPGGILTGVNSTGAPYREVDEEGRLWGESRFVTYQQPVWAYRQWILDTINGAGSSGSTPSPPPSGRRLAETPATGAGTTGNLPMTLPPQTGLCRPATGSCVESDPGWKLGALLGAGNYRGTAEARCATAGGNTCTFDDAPTPPGTATRLPLGPASAPTAPGTREVMVWCKTTTPFPDAGSPAQPVLRVSLTNADPSETQPGYGWWDVTPGQIGTTPSATGQTQLDPATLPAC